MHSVLPCSVSPPTVSVRFSLKAFEHFNSVYIILSITVYGASWNRSFISFLEKLSSTLMSAILCFQVNYKVRRYELKQ